MSQRGCGLREHDDVFRLYRLFAKKSERTVAQADFPTRRIAQSCCPLATWPGRRNVLGSLPSPQSLNEPKSLYHGPSGTIGFNSIQTRNWLRSSRLILRSCMHSARWSRAAGGAVTRFRFEALFTKHHSPNTKRPSSLPSCLTCSGSLAARKRSAS